MKLASEPIEPVDGSTVLVPANRTGVDGDSVIRLSCTVFNQGRFTWTWTMPDSVSSSPPLIQDATRTSVIEVPQNSNSVGEYSCSVSYQSDSRVSAFPTSENFTIEVECECINCNTILVQVIPSTCSFINVTPVSLFFHSLLQWCSIPELKL